MNNDLPELHGFRTLAIVLVVFFHYSLTIPTFTLYNNLVSSGWMGVSLFFILSGFLLSLPFINASKNNTEFPDVMAFYKRRFFRIAPLYYFFLILFLLYQKFTGAYVDYKNLLTNFFFVGNHWVINPVLWSLKIEIRFYLLLPLLMLVLCYLISKKYVFAIITFVLAGLTIPFFYRILALAPKSADAYNQNYTSTVSNFDSFFYGIAIALAYSYLKNKQIFNGTFQQKIISALVLITGISFCVFAQINGQHRMFQSPYGQSILDVIFSSLIILTLISGRTVWTKFLSCRFMTFIATRSYSIYIFHVWIYACLIPFFDSQFSHAFPQLNTLCCVGLSIIATVLLSLVSYKYIESPFLKRTTLIKKDSFFITVLKRMYLSLAPKRQIPLTEKKGPAPRSLHN